MRFLLLLSVCVSCSFRFCSSSALQVQGRLGLLQNVNQQANTLAVNRQGNIHAGNRPGTGGLSFVIPGLSLLAGNNNGGNLFGPATVTRTVVSTVSTVTTASFRTCVAPTAALTPCAAGRRRRQVSAVPNDLPLKIEPTAAMQIVVGPTTIRDREAVAEYLEAHKPCSQSVIYPPNVQPNQIIPESLESQSTDTEFSTPLYPSQDTPETTNSDISEIINDDVGLLTSTETPNLLFDENSEDEPFGTTSSPVYDKGDEEDRARVGLGRTSTVTTVIRVTSVATSLATGTAATLTIMYMGCLPPSLPITGPPCTT